MVNVQYLCRFAVAEQLPEPLSEQFLALTTLREPDLGPLQQLPMQLHVDLDQAPCSSR